MPASDPDQVLSLLGVGPGRVVLLKDVPLARLHLTLRGATESLGQRPGWRPLHSDVCVRSDRPWEERVSGLASVSPRLASWARAAAEQARAALAAVRADDLPVIASCGWPLSELEEAALTPVYRAFRVGMAAAERDSGLVAGDYDLAMIERQLSRTATAPPLSPGLGHY